MLNRIIPANIYLFKVNNKNTRKRFICSKLIIKTAKWRQWRRSGVFIANFERISHLFLMFICWVWAEYLLGLHCHIFFPFSRWNPIILTHQRSIFSSYIETSQLICFANQLCGFYLRGTLVMVEWRFPAPLRNFLVNMNKSAIPADLFTFIKEILNGKLQFLCSWRN